MSKESRKEPRRGSRERHVAWAETEKEPRGAGRGKSEPPRRRVEPLTAPSGPVSPKGLGAADDDVAVMGRDGQPMLGNSDALELGAWFHADDYKPNSRLGKAVGDKALAMLRRDVLVGATSARKEARTGSGAPV